MFSRSIDNESEEENDFIIEERVVRRDENRDDIININQGQA